MVNFIWFLIVFNFFWIDSINLNVDSDSEENGETPFQRLVHLHASHANYNERFFISKKENSFLIGNILFW